MFEDAWQRKFDLVLFWSPVPGLHSPDFKGLLADPMFLAMNSEQRRKVLLRLDPVVGSKIAEDLRDGHQPSEIRDYLYPDVDAGSARFPEGVKRMDL